MIQRDSPESSLPDQLSKASRVNLELATKCHNVQCNVQQIERVSLRRLMRQHDCECVGQLTFQNAAQCTADVGKRARREREVGSGCYCS